MYTKILGILIASEVFTTQYVYCAKTPKCVPLSKVVDQTGIFSGSQNNLSVATNNELNLRGKEVLLKGDIINGKLMLQGNKSEEDLIVPTETMQFALYEIIKALQQEGKKQIFTLKDAVNHIYEKHIDKNSKQGTNIVENYISQLTEAKSNKITTLQLSPLFNSMAQFGETINENDDFETTNKKLLNYMIGRISNNIFIGNPKWFDNSIQATALLDVLISCFTTNVLYSVIEPEASEENGAIIVDFRMKIAEENVCFVVPFHMNQNKLKNATEITLKTCYPIISSVNQLKRATGAQNIKIPLLSPVDYMNRYLRYLYRYDEKAQLAYEKTASEFFKMLLNKGNTYLNTAIDKAKSKIEIQNINQLQTAQFGCFGMENWSYGKIQSICRNTLDYVFGQQGLNLKNNGFCEEQLELLKALVQRGNDLSLPIRWALMLNGTKKDDIQLEKIDNFWGSSGESDFIRFSGQTIKLIEAAIEYPSAREKMIKMLFELISLKIQGEVKELLDQGQPSVKGINLLAERSEFMYIIYNNMTNLRYQERKKIHDAIVAGLYDCCNDATITPWVFKKFIWMFYGADYMKKLYGKEKVENAEIVLSNIANEILGYNATTANIALLLDTRISLDVQLQLVPEYYEQVIFPQIKQMGCEKWFF